MKKQISVITMFAICLALIICAGCHKVKTPCQNGTYKPINDGFITGIAKNALGGYVLYLDLVTFYAQNGYEPTTPEEINDSVYTIKMINDNDTCGIYMTVPMIEASNLPNLQNTTNVIVPCVHIDGTEGCSILNFVFDTKFLCSPDKCPYGTDTCVCVNPSELYGE